MYSSFSESWKENNGEEKTQNKTEKGEQDSNRRNHYFGTLHSIINNFVSHNLNLDLVNRFTLKRLKKKKELFVQFIVWRQAAVHWFKGAGSCFRDDQKTQDPATEVTGPQQFRKYHKHMNREKNSQLSIGLILFFHLATSSTTFIFRWSTLSCWIHTGTVCLHWWNHITEQYIEEICSNWQFYYIF